MDDPNDLQGDEPNEQASIPDFLAVLNDRQRLFVMEYCKDFNATRSAIAAGYSAHTAHAIGYENLRKPEIRAAIDKIIVERTMSADEAIKSISDIARSGLNDYMIVREVEARELVPQLVTVLLSHAKEQIATIREFIKAEGLQEKGGAAFKKQIRQLQLKCLDYQYDIDRYGNLVERLAPGRPVIAERVDIDLVALAKDKEGGRVKSMKPTEYGWSVEMYAADANLEKILKYHGKLPEKHEHSGPNGGAIPIHERTKNTIYIIDTTGDYKVPKPDDDYNDPAK